MYLLPCKRNTPDSWKISSGGGGEGLVIVVVVNGGGLVVGGLDGLGGVDCCCAGAVCKRGRVREGCKKGKRV